MLEILLAQYKMQFGIDFPLKNYAGRAEIDVINIIFDCLQSNNPTPAAEPSMNRFPDAPGLKQS